LPMQALLFVFAGAAVSELIGRVRGSKQPS